MIIEKEMRLSREQQLYKTAKSQQLKDEKDRFMVVKGLLPDVRGKRVLDLGCGLGYSANQISRLAKVNTIDIKNHSAFKIKVKEHNLNDGIPFKNRSFDLIIATEVIEHLFMKNFVLSEICRVMKDGGIAIISLPNEYHIINRILFLRGKTLLAHNPADAFGHQSPFSLDTIKKFIETIFNIIEVKYQYLNGRITKHLRFLPPELVAKTVIMKCVKKNSTTHTNIS